VDDPGIDMLNVASVSLVCLGVVAFLYAGLRVRPGLSLPLQRRALSFIALTGLFFAAAQAMEWAPIPVDGSVGAWPEAALALGRLAAAAGLALCVLIAARTLRASELEEVGPLRRAADIDSLTAVHNQYFFRRAASRRVTQAREYGMPLSLAVIDVDDFKAYNDAFGHEAGNTVLRLVAGVLRRSVRAEDLVARYGGEEFVVMMSCGAGEAAETMERIRLGIEDRCSPVGDEPVRRQVTVSVGVASRSEEAGTLETLIEAADRTMYRAKRSGKNRVASAGEAA